MRSAFLVREVRRRAGITQAELADRAGTTQSAIARWESGGASPSFENLQRIALAGGFALHVSVAPIDADHDRLISDALAKSPEQRLDDLMTRLRVQEQLHGAERVA